MGGKETHTYTGARLKDVLASIGVTNVTSVNATGTDDYTPNMPETKDLAMDNNTLLAWGMDGKNLESIGPVMLTPCSSTVGSQFVKMVATITVTGATLAST
jgi:DMSO/TMAO reductase YedYZ molybdopterin-dependent catalytic subunit